MKKVIVVISLLILSLILISVPSTVRASSASIVLSPSSCYVDPYSGIAHLVSTTITGSGFSPNSIVTLSGPFEEHVPTTANTDSSGSFGAAVLLFPHGGVGPCTCTITAVDSDGNSGSASFTVHSNPLYEYIFVGEGLPDGTSWSVTFDGETKLGTFSGGFSGIIFYRPLGSYSFTIPDAGGITPPVTSGTLSGPGAEQWVVFNSLMVTPETGVGAGALMAVCLIGFVAWTLIVRHKKSNSIITN
jgi:hypothetical protein